MIRTDPAKPYKVGEKVKVYLSDLPREICFTTGIVTKAHPDQKPEVVYANLLKIPLSSFGRIVKASEVILTTSYKTHRCNSYQN